MANPDDALLELRGLRTWFTGDEGEARAVDGVDLTVTAGETLGLVGESGCGKSVTALSIMRLVPFPPGRIVGGEIWFRGRDLLALSEAEMRRIRGDEIAMIFQEPMTALNPVYTVGDQIAEVLRLHRGLDRSAAREQAIRMLERVHIASPAQRAGDYPHQLSGGMRQRVMIAMAISCGPSLLIADEPTTALDVTIQAQILKLMRGLQAEYGMAIVFITHDLGVVAQIADEVAIMYMGRIVEQGPVREIFHNPKHPYTVNLIRAIPRLGDLRARRQLAPIRGTVPSLFERPSGCAFHPRCDSFMAGRCDAFSPPLTRLTSLHGVRCFLHEPAVGEAVP